MAPEATLRVRRGFVARGRVQGVWFRGATAEEARRLGLAGAVWNRRDGCVEGFVEGPDDAVAALLRFASKGPPHARVEDLAVEEQVPEGLQEFRILPTR